MTAQIRVLMINYKMQCAGIEAFIMNIYRNIDRSKIKIDFLVHYTQRQYFDDEIEQSGGVIHRLTIREDNNFIKYLNDLKDIFNRNPQYNIVHGHMESFGLFYLGVAKNAGVPVRIAHSHIAQRNNGAKGLIKSIMNRHYKSNATHLLACSDIAGKFVFGEKSKYQIYNNAIDVDRFVFSSNIRAETRKSLGILNQFVIGHVGRFNTQKNHSFVVNIFSKIHNRDSEALLILIGEGELQAGVKALVKSLNLENNVIFLGVRSDINNLYQAMDVFILPSLFEGLPVAGIEAQTAGLKCIFSDAVTKQTTITDNTEYFPLTMNFDKWATEILKWKNFYSRFNESKSVKNAGYDIESQAKKLEAFYLNAFNEAKNKCPN